MNDEQNHVWTATVAGRHVVFTHPEWVEVLAFAGHEAKAQSLARQVNDGDPDAPHPLAYRVEDTDGRPTWELPGRFVLELGDEWERQLVGGCLWFGPEDPSVEAGPHCVYLVRRVAPSEPQTVTGPERLPDGVYRSKGDFFMVAHWWDDVPDGWERRHDADPSHEVFAVVPRDGQPSTERRHKAADGES